MAKHKYTARSTGQLSSYEHNRRKCLVQSGKASWYKPYRIGAEAACDAAGIP